MKRFYFESLPKFSVVVYVYITSQYLVKVFGENFITFLSRFVRSIPLAENLDYWVDYYTHLQVGVINLITIRCLHSAYVQGLNKWLHRAPIRLVS